MQIMLSPVACTKRAARQGQNISLFKGLRVSGVDEDYSKEVWS
jgi:hypothetical protein